MKTHIINSLFIFVLASLGYVATDIYLPSMPQLSEYFSASENETQLTLSFYMLSFSATPLIFGPLSDHYGRKKLIIFGLIIAFISTVSCLLATSIYWLIGSRFVQGIGGGAIMISARSMTGDLFKGPALAKQISYLTMFMSLTLAIAPTLGGALQDSFGWHSVFLFLICYLVIIGIFTFLFLKESNEKLSQKKLSRVFSGYKEVLRNKSFVICGLGMIPTTIGLFAYLTSSPFIFQENIGLTAAEYGSLAIVLGGTILTSSFINSRLLHRYSLDTLLRVGTFLMIAGGLLMMFFHYLGVINTWSVLIPSLIFYGSLPFSVGNSASKAISQISTHYGAANGLLTSGQFIAGAIGSFIFSLIEENDAFPLSVCFLAMGLISAGILLISTKQTK